MEIEISPATPEKEWSPGLEEQLEDTMELLRPLERTLAAPCTTVGEFTVTLTKVGTPRIAETPDSCCKEVQLNWILAENSCHIDLVVRKFMNIVCKYDRNCMRK